ncbi:MAG TPA: zeta toxin family protein [Gammaproteobacteria bacterium]|nr:zeta toxin family protein [Gammaproteobacteria bacterium]
MTDQTGVHKGDHIYFQSADGPRAGCVKAVGEHGCTVHCEGQQHRVRWCHVLGHKQRMQHAVRIVDQGEDGALVEDEDGQRRYLAGRIGAGGEVIDPAALEAAVTQPDEAKEDEPMHKALIPDDAQILFLKGGPIKNRPGLSLRDITDKSGRHAKHWVKTGEEPHSGKDHTRADDEPRGAAHGYGTHDIDPGDHIEFKTPSGQGGGQVVAVGKDGVSVEDKHGNQHQIRWKFVTDFKGGEGAAGGGGGKGNDNGSDTGATDDDEPPKKDGDESGKGKAQEESPLAKEVAAIIAEHRKVLGPQKPVPPDQFSAADYYAANNDPDVSADDIIGIFPDAVRDKIDVAQKRLKEIEQTIDIFNPGGNGYTPERLEKHKEIIGHFMSPEKVAAARPAEGETPTFTILGGRGGSGKSWFDGNVFDPDKAIVLDADKIKGMLPEYEGWNAAQVHEESSQLFDLLTDMAQDQGLNLVHDATMKTKEKAVKLVQRFKDAGYRTEAHYMHLPRQEAAKRAVGRFLGKTGRYVPVDVVLANTGNEASFDAVRGMVDDWSFRDNNVAKGTEPVLISRRGGNDDDDGQALHKAHSRNAGLRGLSPRSGDLSQGAGGRDQKAVRGTGATPGRLTKAMILLRAPFARLRKSEPDYLDNRAFLRREARAERERAQRGQLTLFLTDE